ncbi:protein LAZ1 [Selaginella moellendorffii]|uniref:protein LAZ1 n=1 Tax=Selaginella moellendorffii TaxID=88036 RepID=UPI000D1C754B|nr:protein LAZ1 [Selaginella moellendorffii]|eukprot:XP_024530263.1 protein LAZ1 [Selaginella moellendorffii]
MLSWGLLLDRLDVGGSFILAAAPGPDDAVTSIHTWAVIVAGIFVLIALTLSTFLIFEHLTSYNKPEEQKWLVGIIFMVPVYSVESLVSLWNNELSLVCDILRNCYEAFALYSFGCYLIACLGGEDRVVDMLERQAIAGPRTPLLVRSRSSGKAAVKHPIPLNCCLTPWSLGQDFYHIVKFGIVQYMILKTTLSFLSLFLNVFDAYGEGEFKWYYGYPYVTVILNFSQTWALYCLVQFYAVTKDELHHIQPLSKFICFKAIVFATWWQGVAIAVLFGSGAAKGVAPEGVKLQSSLQDFIICIEMAIAAVAHIYCFPARPYQQINEFGQRSVAVLSDYASMDSPLDPDEVKESERRSILRFLPPEMENVATSLKESMQDVVMVGGEQIVHDVKFTVSQAVEPMEKGINRLNETLHDKFHQLPGQLPWHGRHRSGDGKGSKRLHASKDDAWIRQGLGGAVRGIDDPLLSGSVSDTGLLRKKFKDSASYGSGAESSGESSDQGGAGFKTGGRRWTLRS